MSATAATHTAGDLTTCVAGLLLDLAYHVMPDTYGCPRCEQDECPVHSAQAAVQQRYEEAAAMAGRATTAEEVRAAVTHARGDGGTGE